MDRLKHRLVAAECRIEELEEELELAVAHGKESTERMKEQVHQCKALSRDRMKQHEAESRSVRDKSKVRLIGIPS